MRAGKAKRRRAGDVLPDPSSTDRVYSEAETEFLRAVQDWQARTGLRFPTNCDLFKILIDLGYHK